MAQWYCDGLLIRFPSGSPGSIPGPGVNPSFIISKDLNTEKSIILLKNQ